MKQTGNSNNQAVVVQTDSVTRGHYAALRAWIQGLPLDLVAARYLGHDPENLPDVRRVLAEILFVRDELVQRAHQHDLPELAGALQRDFRSSNVGMDKALQAIGTLERRGSPSPAASHAVDLWFAPALARRLRNAEVRTLDDLVKLCNSRGRAWWRRIPRIGAKAAAAIVAWLGRHEKSLQVRLGSHVIGENRAVSASRPLMTIEPRIPTVPPLEGLMLPSAFDGSTGRNRAPRQRCMVAADNDYQAIMTWLSLWPKESHTWRAYRKESERFLTWAVIERGKAMSSLLVEDCIAYRDFLRDPQPASRWVGPMTSRWSPSWRPFQGPLSSASQKYTLTVLRSLCEWLTRQHYLNANPWDGVPGRIRTETRIQTEKALSGELWEHLWDWLEVRAAPEHAQEARIARAAIALVCDSGMRREEACRADRSNLLRIADPDAPGVWGELMILGKRNVLRGVPVSERAVGALRAHWRDRGEDFDRAISGPLLAPLRLPATPRSRAKAERGQHGYSPGGLHGVIARTARSFGATLFADDPELAAQAERMRAHALRHTFGTRSAANEVPLDVIQMLLGHASLATTTIYTQGERKRRLQEIGKLYGGRIAAIKERRG